MRAELIVDEIKRQGVTHIIGLPDNGARTLFEALWRDPDLEVVTVTREGEAFAIASGLYLGGKHPLVVIQNTGFFESGDAFRGMAHNMGVPLVMLLGYRGYKSLAPGSPRIDTAASFFEPTLKAWDIPYAVLASEEEVTEQIDAAFRTAASTSLPAAVLLTVETT